MTDERPPAEERAPEGGWKPEGPPSWPVLLSPVPPVPPVQPRRALDGPRALAGALVVTLVVSLVASAMLATRVRRARDELEVERIRASALAERLEDLRAGLRGQAGGDRLDAIATAVERLRGLEFEDPPKPEILSPADFKARVRRLLERDSPRDEVEASAKVLRALGVIPRGFDLHASLLGAAEEQVAGFYDHRTKRLVVPAGDPDDLSPLERVFLAHEYTHALMDQRVGLRDLEELVDQGKDDEVVAYQALSEGDASLTMGLYQQEALSAAEQLEVTREALALLRGQTQTLPPFLQDALEFPYTKGLDFVRELHDRGGFDLVDRAYRDPPVSTEQILHPSRYLDDRDAPTRVRMPDVRRALGAGWSPVQDGTFGELDVSLVADVFLGSTESRRAAAGWDGGAYAAFASRAGALVAVLTVWDSQAEARQATTAFARWLPRRFEGRGREMVLAGAARAWSSGEGAAAVLRDGARMLLVVGPDEGSVRRARGAFGGF